jgi:hypothetical protein
MTEQDAKKALAKLFLCFSQSGDEIERKGKLLAYWETLQSREPRFVIDACEYASKGKLGDGRFLPTAAELYHASEEFAAREARIRIEARPKLREEPCQHDEATRQRIIAGFAKLLADLHNGNKIDPAKATREVFHPSPIETPRNA